MILTKPIKITNQGDNFKIGEVVTQEPELYHLTIGTQVAEFKGVNAMLEFLAKHMPEPKMDGNSASQGTGFSGFNTYEEAWETFYKYPSKIREFTEKDDPLTGGDSGLKVVNDVTGDMLDMGRYLAGEPECWSSLVDGTPRGRRVNLVIDISQTASTDSSDIRKRASRVVRLVDWLESQNVRTQILGIESTECTHTEVMVKNYFDPLNLNDVAVISHPGFLRRIIFRLAEYSKTFSSGYGSAVAFTETVARNPDILGTEPGEVSVYIGSHPRRNIPVEFDGLEKTLAEQLSGENKTTNLAVLT